MNFTTRSQKLDALQYFIEKGRVKTVKDIAMKLDVCERTALRFISLLKEKNINIKYSVKDKAYKIIA